MHIGAAKAKGVDAGKLRAAVTGHFLKAVRDAKIESGEVDLGIGCVEVKIGRNLPVAEDERYLDKTCNSRGGFEMTNIRFDGTDNAG